MKDDYFDDCEICRAMQLAEKERRNLGYEELRRAFRKQKESGVGIVGFWDEED